jgi:hypothetical protein
MAVVTKKRSETITVEISVKELAKLFDVPTGHLYVSNADPTSLLSGVAINDGCIVKFHFSPPSLEERRT